MTARSRDWLVVLCVVFYAKLLVLPSYADFPLEELYRQLLLLLIVGSPHPPSPSTPLSPSPLSPHTPPQSDGTIQRPLHTPGPSPSASPSY